MKVSLIQQNIIWADPAANTAHLDEILPSLEGADIVVLPEMFSTGFATSAEGIAENNPPKSLQWMKSRAAEMNCAIAGSIATKDGDNYCNRFCFVTPDGNVTTYDKRHLFTYGGEHHRYTAGKDRVIVQWRGVRFLLAVCYDLRFPVWLRNRKDYDAMIIVASWPEVRRKAWDALLRARAIENQCFVLAVNRVGDDPSLHYNGGTVLLDPWGAEVEAAQDSKEQAVTALLDMNRLAQFRKDFPVLDDADPFTITK